MRRVARHATDQRGDRWHGPRASSPRRVPLLVQMRRPHIRHLDAARCSGRKSPQASAELGTCPAVRMDHSDSALCTGHAERQQNLAFKEREACRMDSRDSVLCQGSTGAQSRATAWVPQPARGSTAVVFSQGTMPPRSTPFPPPSNLPRMATARHPVSRHLAPHLVAAVVAVVMVVVVMVVVVMVVVEAPLVVKRVGPRYRPTNWRC